MAKIKFKCECGAKVEVPKNRLKEIFNSVCPFCERIGKLTRD